MKTCSIEGCHGNVFGKGWCAKHYFRMKNHGSLTIFDDAQTQFDWLVSALASRSADCLEWPYSLSHKGYGRVAFGGRSRGAHRVALAWHDGYCPPDLEAAHRCNNRKCVNPDHLYWATAKQNKHDCLLLGTQSRKLTKDEAVAVLAAKGQETTRTLADRYGVSTDAIRQIWKGKTWAWLTQDQQRGGCRVNTQ